jgi:hypothetical protein
MGFLYKNSIFQLAKTKDEFLQFAVSIQRSTRADTYKINPSIILRNPFMQFPEQELLVLANLRKDGVHLHVTTSSWWPPDALEDALCLVKRHAFPWYEKWGRPERLAQMLDTSINSNKDLINVMEPLAERDTTPPWKQPNPSFKRVPGKYFYHAAVLHYLSGNTELARSRTNDWLNSLSAREGTERAKAIAQMSALSRIH